MTDQLLICAPMRIEARAIRQGLRAGSGVVRTASDPKAPTVLHTGYGTTRAAQRAEELKAALVRPNRDHGSRRGPDHRPQSG